MGALTSQIPKPLLPIGPKPLLEHILDRLREADIERVAIVIGYRGKLIQQHFAKYPMPISWFHQTELNGTAPAVGLTCTFTGEDPFLLTFGDIWCDVNDYRGLMSTLLEVPNVEAVLGVRWVDDPFQGAAVYVDGEGNVVKIVEKPVRGTSETNWNSAGLYVFRPSIKEAIDRVSISQRGEYEITSAIERLIEGKRKLRYYAVSESWHDVGHPEDLYKLSEALGYRRVSSPQTPTK
jgi:dTDP-glucose pyrophosphorylase